MHNRIELAQARTVDWLLSRSGACRPSLLVSGFMRSGTTWVQECMASSLGAKTVFEPLSPLEPGRRAALPSDVGTSESTMQGTIPEPWPEDHPAWGYLTRVCRGRSTSRFSLTCRQGRRDSLRRTIVVKDVRLQFNLEGFHDRFDVPVLHVTRDPCAVVASLSKADWGWSYDAVRLHDVLPRSAEVWACQTMTREDVIRYFDGNGISRIVAMWAVSERFVAQSLHGKPWARRVSYEILSADPAKAFADLHDWLGLKARRPCDFARRSASTYPDSVLQFCPDELCTTTMIDRDRSRVLGIAAALHPNWHAGDTVAS